MDMETLARRLCHQHQTTLVNVTFPRRVRGSTAPSRDHKQIEISWMNHQPAFFEARPIRIAFERRQRRWQNM